MFNVTDWKFANSFFIMDKKEGKIVCHDHVN